MIPYGGLRHRIYCFWAHWLHRYRVDWDAKHSFIHCIKCNIIW